MKNRRIITVGTVAIALSVVGLLCFLSMNNRDRIYKPNGKTDYERVVIAEETNPYYQIGYSDYVFVGRVIKENNRYINEYDSPRTTYQIAVMENLKGDLQNEIEVIYPGGYDRDGTLILSKGDYITDESLPDIDETYIFVGIGQSSGDILLQTLYTDTVYNESSRDKFLDYINNSDEVIRDRSASKYENDQH